LARNDGSRPILRRLNVSFDLTVGDCTVPVTGIFHQP